MKFAGRLKTFALVAGAVLLSGLGLVGWGAAVGPGGVFVLLLVFGLVGGAFGYAYVTYRQGRQREVLHLLTAAVVSRIPLPPVIDSYLSERPRRLFWWAVFAAWATGMTLFVPGLLLLWWWLWRRRFDHQLARLADLLDAGVPLPDALAETRGVVSGEVRIAAGVGTATGRLAECLARADRERSAAAWLELVPRLLYPLFLVWFLSGVVTFLMTMIIPKYKKIFDEFGAELPPATLDLIGAWKGIEAGFVLFFLAMLGATGAAVAVVLFPSVRWHLPGVGRLYRWEVQGEVLRLLGTLTEVGKPAPEALRTLAAADGFPAAVGDRLDDAVERVERGEPFPDALRDARLLPAGFAPLVASAERTRTLPWTLSELGDHLGAKALRLTRRVSLVVAPACVAVVGVGVGFVVLAMFLPLIKLITGLAE